ncbi:hypothetical protein [Ferrimonas balearica]|uniref:hypothetical protein n=1 Tax=Ferrimonas balearica TaxID=44012 RepID=UPI001C9913E5|nr:hypothetical protein [Ferrimonas balearica]MBY5991262.1 hypothetical protein [Ferrimonas balearica]
MTDMILEISPAMFSTPLLSGVISTFLTLGLGYWAYLAYDYNRTETEPKLWNQ